MSTLPAILIALILLILITLLIVSISILLKDTETGAEIDDMIAGIIKSMRRKHEN